MCGRFGFFELGLFIEQLRQLKLPFDEAPGFAYRQSWNIAPESRVVTLLGDHDRYTLGLAYWGLIPRWSERMPKIRPINARAEGIASKPYFRHMLNRHHCVIPASGFFEWKAAGGPRKEAWYVHRRDGKPMALAGLWDEWRDPESDRQEIVTCTIVTTGANRDMSSVHDRMPVILEPGEWKTWLESGNPDATALLKPAGEGILELYRVSTAVNNPRNDDSSCIEREELETGDS